MASLPPVKRTSALFDFNRKNAHVANGVRGLCNARAGGRSRSILELTSDAGALHVCA